MISKTTNKLIILFITFFMIFNISSVKKVLGEIIDNDIPEKFVITHIVKRSDILNINGMFVNCSKDKVYNFKNVTFTIKDSSQNPPLTYQLNSSELKNIDLPSGNTSKEYTFKIQDDKLKKINLKTIQITSKYDYLTEYNNSYDKGFHFFFKNQEVDLDNKPFIDNSNKIFIPIDAMSSLKSIWKQKESKSSKVPLKRANYSDIEMFNNQPYIQLESLMEYLNPKTVAFTYVSNDYSSLIFYLHKPGN